MVLKVHFAVRPRAQCTKRCHAHRGLCAPRNSSGHRAMYRTGRGTHEGTAASTSTSRRLHGQVADYCRAVAARRLCTSTHADSLLFFLARFSTEVATYFRRLVSTIHAFRQGEEGTAFRSNRVRSHERLGTSRCERRRPKRRGSSAAQGAEGHAVSALVVGSRSTRSCLWCSFAIRTDVAHLHRAMPNLTLPSRGLAPASRIDPAHVKR